jgi:hypothetical protein
MKLGGSEEIQDGRQPQLKRKQFYGYAQFVTVFKNITHHAFRFH